MRCLFCLQGDVNKHPKNCTLTDFHEGFVGKLCIHKSGRTTLKLGNTILQVHLGTPPGFLQVRCHYCHEFSVIFLNTAY